MMKTRKLSALLLAFALLLALALPASADVPELSATAEAARIQKYGNVVLSLTREELLAAGYAYGDVVTVAFLDRTLDLPLCSNYTDVDSGAPGLFAREADANVCLAICMGDFAGAYGLATKTTHEDKSFDWSWTEGISDPLAFTIRMKEPGGYHDEYLLHQLSYTDAREDYPALSDADFANFRAVETTGMGKGVLYRTASPVNPEHNRNAYADAALRAAGVTVVMNLADDEATLRAYPGFAESYYATTAFIALNMGVDFAAAEFRDKLAEGLRFFAEHPGVYAVHCTEGKDRAGFVTALLECLMGASWEEVAADYMRTFYNYYGVTQGDPRYDAVMNSNLVKNLTKAFGVGDLQSADLSACAETYLKSCGVTDETLAALRKNLSAAPAEGTAPATGSGALPFADVPAAAWYADGVRYAYEKGLMKGTSDAAFSPDAALTRAQLVTILWRVAGEPAGGDAVYADVPGDAWFAKAACWALGAGLTDRESGSFGPDDALRRDEAVYLLWNTAKYLGADVSVGEDTNILSYDDAFDIAEGRASAMQWAVGADVLRGTGGATLSPGGLLTRAQTAVLLRRFAAALRAPSPLSLWTEGSTPSETLIAYIEAITDEDSADYIPVRNRIAVFDLDGTLFCETDPNYFDYTLLKYRVLEDPDYRDRASEFEREVANKIKEQNETGKSFPGLEVDHGRAVASAFAGMTVAEFNAYIQDFKQQPMPSYTGMKRGEGWYLPMLQLVRYLQENEFTVYVVSGTDRLIVRGIVYDSPLDVPNRQIIGSDETIVSSGQGGADGLNYVFKEGDALILGGEFLIKNLKMNKVSVIMQEIGQQPVLSFGNSTGDSSMAEFVTSGNPYKSLAFMLCCDDTVRENGSQSKADKMFALCEEYDWVPVSMKNDWTTIYGEDVVYTGAQDAAA